MSVPEKESAPVRQSVLVDCPIDVAFELFTDQFAEWWPLAAHSISGDDAVECVIEPWVGGRVYERTQSGEEHDWGSVKTWDPPHRLSLTWNPDQTVDIDFTVEADGTRVTLIHTGWTGWTQVMQCFAQSVHSAAMITC